MSSVYCTVWGLLYSVLVHISNKKVIYGPCLFYLHILPGTASLINTTVVQCPWEVLIHNTEVCFIRSAGTCLLSSQQEPIRSVTYPPNYSSFDYFFIRPYKIWYLFMLLSFARAYSMHVKELSELSDIQHIISICF